MLWYNKFDAWGTVRGLDRVGDFTQSTMSAGRRIGKGYTWILELY